MIVMRKLLWLLLLVAVAGPLQEIDAQNKLKQKTVVSKNGDKYVGTVYKERDRLTGKKKFVKTGEGKMYYVDGSVFEGEWLHNYPSKGTYRTGSGDVFKGVFRAGNPFRGRCEYTSGDVFEGTVTGWGRLIPVNGLYKYKDGDVFEGKFWEGIPEEGTKTFAAAGDILIGGNRWSYPASCRFIGRIRSWSGLFDCPLKNTKGDIFEGKIQNRNFIQGKISYANGNIFEGDFAKNAPKNGVFFYACETNVLGWTIPAGSKFTGDVVALTGAFDQPIVNIEGDRYTGTLKCGKPDGQGSMTYARTGKTESGIWHEGLSPSAYRAHLEQQRKEEEQQALAALEAAMARHGNELVLSKDSPNQIVLGLAIRLSHLFEGQMVVVGGGKRYSCQEILLDKNNLQLVCLDAIGSKTTYDIRALKKSETLPDPYRHRGYPKEGLNAGRDIFSISVGDGVMVYLAYNWDEAARRIERYFRSKYGEYWGDKVLAKELTIGMTREMCGEIVEKGAYDISRYRNKRGELEIWTYSPQRQRMASVEAMFGMLLLDQMGIGALIDKYSYQTLTFENGKLTGFSK